MEIFPCPFCGNYSTYFGEINHWITGVRNEVRCSKCHASGGEDASLKGAIEKWNTRTLPEDIYQVKIGKEIKEWFESPIDE